MDAIMQAIRRRGDGNAENHEPFGRLTRRIDRIKNNDPAIVEFTVHEGVAHHFSDSAWKLIGRYIAENDHLESIHFRTVLLNESTVVSSPNTMSMLFEELSRGSNSVRKMYLAKTDFGVNGTKLLTQFLENSHLTMLDMREIERLNTECFRLIIAALDGGSIECLRIRSCESIGSIAAFENYTLPHLRVLNLATLGHRGIVPSFDRYSNLERLSLEGNWIGSRGYPSVAKLLLKESPPLKSLDLTFTGMRDPEAELIADSLKKNTSLNHLGLEGNKINDGGRRAFLKLLNDASSIKSVCNSNHTLRSLELPRSFDLGVVTMFNHIDLALNINRAHVGNAHAASRAKVVETQLCSNTRMELSRLQLVHWCYDSILPQIVPPLLPDVLAMVGNEHGQSELYRILIATVSDLASIVNKKIALKERVAKNESRITSLNTEYALKKSDLLAEYQRQLAALTTGNLYQTAALAAENSELEKQLEQLS